MREKEWAERFEQHKTVNNEKFSKMKKELVEKMEALVLEYEESFESYKGRLTRFVGRAVDQFQESDLGV